MPRMQRFLALVLACATAVLTSTDMRADSRARTAQPADLDVLIRNARVMDGAGNPWIRADIGIRGDRIVSVTRPLASTTPPPAKRVIDAGDRVVTPGFIDVHSHAAEGLVRPELRQGQA